jgi:hypothetical protein
MWLFILLKPFNFRFWVTLFGLYQSFRGSAFIEADLRLTPAVV